MYIGKLPLASEFFHLSTQLPGRDDWLIVYTMYKNHVSSVKLTKFEQVDVQSWPDVREVAGHVCSGEFNGGGGSNPPALNRRLPFQLGHRPHTTTTYLVTLVFYSWQLLRCEAPKLHELQSGLF